MLICYLSSHKRHKLLIWIHFCLIVVLYATTAYYSPGFDDEYFNMMVVEHFSTGVASFIKKTDAHPPLSYLLNAWLYKFLGGWERVRMLSGLLTASAIIFTIYRLGKSKELRFSLILIYLMAFNPALLMWGTSLRWYSYFLPIVIWLMVIPLNSHWHWPKFFIGAIMMGMIGHLIYFIFPSLLIYYWLNDKRGKEQKRKSFVFSALLALLAYLPLLIDFFKFYIPRSGGQTFSIGSSLLATLSTCFSNQGVFPISIPGLMGIIGTCIIIINLLKNKLHNASEPNLVSLALSILVFSGIAGKMRNLLVIIPIQAIWLSEKLTSPISRSMRFAVGLLIFSNLIGTYNVIMHEDTTKTSWNIPVNKVKKIVWDKASTNQSSVIVYCHDPIITWHLEKMGFSVRSVYAKKVVALNDKKINEIIVIWTNPGVISNQKMQSFHAEISLIKCSLQTDYILGIDKYAAFKRIKEAQYPDELVKISILQNPLHIAQSSVWTPTFVNRLQ